jgi:hypothetical protein
MAEVREMTGIKASAIEAIESNRYPENPYGGDCLDEEDCILLYYADGTVEYKHSNACHAYNALLGVWSDMSDGHFFTAPKDEPTVEKLVELFDHAFRTNEFYTGRQLLQAAMLFAKANLQACLNKRDAFLAVDEPARQVIATYKSNLFEFEDEDEEEGTLSDHQPVTGCVPAIPQYLGVTGAGLEPVHIAIQPDERNWIVPWDHTIATFNAWWQYGV